MKQPSGEFVPKQDMINEIFKELELSKEAVEDISEEDVAAQITTGFEQPAGELVELLLKKCETLDEDDLDSLTINQKTMPVPAPDTSKGVNAQVIIDVAPDQMSAKIRITPPQMGGRTVTEDDILEALRENRIIKGIKFEYVYRLAHHTVYNRAFKIAQGAAPTDGEDAKLIFHFDKADEPEVFRDEKDYAQIQYTTVKSGDLLCEIEPATPARNGWNILGKSLAGKEGKSLVDVAGSNTMQFNTALYATCDGLVSIRDDKINVYRAVTKKELDNRKVDFEGTVVVEGNVMNNSVIRAEGDIIVKGSVQNSKLFSNGNIITYKGITGRDSVIQAKEGYLRSYFIENAQVEVGKDITTDIVMKSDISCGGTLRLAGKRENLLGGVCRIGKDLYVKNVGNSANIPTDIFLMGKEPIRKEKEKALERIAQCREAIDKLMQALQKTISTKKTAEDRKKLAIELTYAKKKLEKEIEDQNELLKELCLREGVASSGKIVVRGRMYPNVNLSIDGVTYKNEKEQSRCTITKHREELLFSAVKEERH